MSIRRLFWLGAAVLFSIAALIAIVAVVGGHFEMAFDFFFQLVFTDSAPRPQ